MPTDREIAARALDMQARARDFRLLDIPAYKEWSQRKLDEGESSAFIADLDSKTMWLRPEDVVDVGEAEFEELLEDIKTECGE